MSDASIRGPSVSSALPSAVPGVNVAKLRPPRSTSDVVGHDRLRSLRPEPGSVPVVSVVAPAGYGKTTLLSEWARHATGPALWVTLDKHDDDPTRMVMHLAQATIEAGASDPALEEVMRAPAASVWSSLVPRLTVALQGLGPYTLVLDDIESVTSPEVLDVIEWLAMHVPVGAQLIIGGRPGAALKMTRLQAHGQLAMLGPADLSLDDAEAYQLLLDRGRAVGRDESARLNRACEGWVTGLLLMTELTSAASGPNAVPSLDAAQLVEDYISTEILGQLTPDEADFVLGASVLRTGNGPLCDAALGRTDSGPLLRRLCADSAFVTLLGDGWCRLHDLLRTALVARLEREDPERASEIRSRAAAWQAEHGTPESAVHYSMDSGRHPETVELFRRFMVVEYSRGRLATVEGWLDWADTEGLLRGEPLLTLSGGMVAALTGKPERMEGLAATRRPGQVAGTAAYAKDVAEGYHLLLDSWQCRRGAEVMLEDATRAADLIPTDDPWWASAIGARAVAELMNGMLDASATSWHELLDTTALDGPDTNASSLAHVFLASQALKENDVETAKERIDRSIRLRNAAGITRASPQALHDAVAARVSLLLGPDVAEARGALARAQALRPLVCWAIPGLAMPIRLELIRTNLMLGDVAATRVLVREVADILRHRPGLGAFETDFQQLRDQVDEQVEQVSGPSSLTDAELRLIPWLATHLSFREIGERLYLSTNTVKTEALSAYRKLGVSSRSDAVAAAVRVGLLDAASLPTVLQRSIDDVEG